MLDRKEVIEKAMAFPMDKVVYRYQQDKALSTAQARRHERELKRFLALVALNDKGYVLAPAKKPAKITALKFGQVVMRAPLSMDALSLKKGLSGYWGPF